MSGMKKRKKLPSVQILGREVEALCSAAFMDSKPKDVPKRIFVHTVGKAVYIRAVITRATDAETLDILEIVREQIADVYRAKVITVCHIGARWNQKRIVNHVNKILVEQGFVEEEGF